MDTRQQVTDRPGTAHEICKMCRAPYTVSPEMPAGPKSAIRILRPGLGLNTHMPRRSLAICWRLIVAATRCRFVVRAASSSAPVVGLERYGGNDPFVFLCYPGSLTAAESAKLGSGWGRGSSDDRSRPLWSRGGFPSPDASEGRH